MSQATLIIDLHIGKKVKNDSILLFNADNFTVEEIQVKLAGLIEKHGGDLNVLVEKLCFYANNDRLSPVHAVHKKQLETLNDVYEIIENVSAYALGDEIRMNTVLGALEHSCIPAGELTRANIEAIVATTYRVSTNYKINSNGVKEDIRNKDLIYREVGRGICIGLYPTHPFQVITK